MSLVNNGKLTKPLKSLVNRNNILEYDTQLAQLDTPHLWQKNVQSQALVIQQRKRYDAAEKSKREGGCSL